ncbi:Cytochrome c556 [Azotobacter beijerinckii]|uniref:Cytochrome c556 n=2 Tax=Azotobacter beijerinckii TaxID=170623 RepID=A0A1H6TAQ4_9GAMM|nr:Cytochrome c556 [Azotobacter beijerinckii]SER22014.1 Cytochrome c556 [Azotobacter beijerinckii]
MKRLMIGGLGAALLLTALTTWAQLKPEEQIEYRQAGYQFMSWNMGKIKAQVVDGSVPYKKEQVVAAANAIAAIANSGMGALFPAGTATDKMGDKTRLKPEFFQNIDEANKLARNFTGAVNKLASEAASGDQARIKTAFGEAAKTCKACHDQFRTD